MNKPKTTTLTPTEVAYLEKVLKDKERSHDVSIRIAEGERKEKKIQELNTNKEIQKKILQ